MPPRTAYSPGSRTVSVRLIAVGRASCAAGRMRDPLARPQGSDAAGEQLRGGTRWTTRIDGGQHDSRGRLSCRGRRARVSVASRSADRSRGLRRDAVVGQAVPGREGQRPRARGERRERCGERAMRPSSRQTCSQLGDAARRRAAAIAAASMALRRAEQRDGARTLGQRAAIVDGHRGHGSLRRQRG